MLGAGQPFGFTGYERDGISGLYYAQARRYDAKTGRFTSRDIIKGNISQMQSQNEYAYCLGNPLMYVDRDGREQQFVSGDDYRFVGYDENGNIIVQKKDGESYNYHTVYYLNAENGAGGAGHAAILLVNDEKEGYYYNMAKDGNFTSYYLNEKEVESILTNGEIDVNYKTLDKSKKAYNRYIKKYVTNSEARRMIEEAKKHENDKYSLFINNCTQVATQILNAGGKNYKEIPIPNIMFSYLKKEQNVMKE